MEASPLTAAKVDLMDLAPFIAGEEHKLFRRLREDDPLHWNDEPNGPGFWSLTRYADVIKAIDDPATYINGEGTQILSRRVEGHTPTVHNMDPPRHTAMRAIATPHLRAVKVREWQAIIELERRGYPRFDRGRGRRRVRRRRRGPLTDPGARSGSRSAPGRLWPLARLDQSSRVGRSRVHGPTRREGSRKA